MNLPLVDVFNTNYKFYSYRDATDEEFMAYHQEHGHLPPPIPDQLLNVVRNHYDAAKHIITQRADNGLESFITSKLKQSEEYQYSRNQMPIDTPSALEGYQKAFPNYDPVQVDIEINKIDCKLGQNQMLFHAGLWENHAVTSFITTKPLSTSFCPQVAIRNSEWQGKASAVGRIDLFLLKVNQPNTNVYFYDMNDPDKGNEKEVLFASGAELNLTNITKICSDYPINASKNIDVNIIEIEIS